MFKTLLSALMLVIIMLLPLTDARADFTDSIVKVYVTASTPNYYVPWVNSSFNTSSGSGCIIDGNRILTNAHVVSNATYIEVQRNGTAERFPAKVLAVSHEADLALLQVDLPEFFQDVQAIPLGGLPETQKEVLVYGFPKGGEGLSVTKGVVSRIEMRTYSHSRLDLLSLQIDAAINNGNSGGPVILDGKIIGIAMQTLSNAENIGHVIPIPVIQHFLDDMQDGSYDGFPIDGFYGQQMNNSLLQYVGLPEKANGIFVHKVMPGSAAEGLIAVGDVILSIDGHTIARDGTTVLREGLRVNGDYFTLLHQLGETMQLQIWRDGEKQEISLPLTMAWGKHALVSEPQYDVRPEYYIYGGLVFTPLTHNLIKAWGRQWYKDAPTNYLYYYLYKTKTQVDEEIVVLSRILNSEVVSAYADFDSARVVAVNQQGFNSFKEFVDLVEVTAAQEEMLVFELAGGQLMVITVADHKRLIEHLLQQYRISSDRYLAD